MTNELSGRDEVEWHFLCPSIARPVRLHTHLDGCIRRSLESRDVSICWLCYAERIHSAFALVSRGRAGGKRREETKTPFFLLVSSTSIVPLSTYLSCPCVCRARRMYGHCFAPLGALICIANARRPFLAEEVPFIIHIYTYIYQSNALWPDTLGMHQNQAA